MASTPTPASLVIDGASTSATSFYAFDSIDSRFYIRARIDTYSDYLMFRIIAKIPSTRERSSIIPELFFDAMMDHFSNQPGGLPTAIRSIWDDTNPECMTNLERFNNALLANGDEITAAKTTFTGRMAAKYNYHTIVLGLADPPNGPAPYRRVTVYFKR